MAEQEFQNEVISIADKNGWLWFHHPYECGEVRPGWPDLVLVHPRRKLLLFRELKWERRKLEPAQSTFLHALQAVGADAKVWRPKDRDEIVKVLEDESDDDAQEDQEARQVFNKAYKEARKIYEVNGIFKETDEANIDPRDPRNIEERRVREEVFDKAYKAAEAKKAFDKAFQDYDYEFKKEVREANKAYEAFNKAYEAFNKVEVYKAAKAAEKKAKAIEEAAEKVFYQAREEVDRIEKVNKKAQKKAGEASKKRNNAYEAFKKTREAFDTSEQPLSAAFAAQEAYCQAKKAHNIKAAEANKTEKAFYQAKEKANEAEKAFCQAKEKAEKAALRTRKARKAAEKAGLHIDIYSTDSAKAVYRLHRERRKVK